MSHSPLLAIRHIGMPERMQEIPTHSANIDLLSMFRRGFIRIFNIHPARRFSFMLLEMRLTNRDNHLRSVSRYAMIECKKMLRRKIGNSGNYFAVEFLTEID